MSVRKTRRQRCAVEYPKHAFQPVELLRFVELKPFTNGWDDMDLDDDDLMALQIMLMLHPKVHPVVPGTGGLRKMRFAPKRWHTGKRGAARIGFAYLEEWGTILLVIAYSKNEKDDLTPDEKETIRRIIRRIEHEFSSGLIR